MGIHAERSFDQEEKFRGLFTRKLTPVERSSEKRKGKCATGRSPLAFIIRQEGTQNIFPSDFPRTATLVRRAADSILAATIQSYRLRFTLLQEVLRALHLNFQFQEKHPSVTN